MASPRTATKRPAAKKAPRTSKSSAPTTPSVTEADATGKPKADALTRGDLLTRVKASAGEVNGQVASAIMDIVLLELGQALRDGKTVKALPVGNLVVQKRKTLEDGEVLMCKLRIKDPKVENPDNMPTASAENEQ